MQKKYIDEKLESNLTSIVNCDDFKEWYDIVSPILLSEEFQKRKLKLKNYQNRIQKKLEEEAFGIDTVSKKKINYKTIKHLNFDQTFLFD